MVASDFYIGGSMEERWLKVVERIYMGACPLCALVAGVGVRVCGDAGWGRGDAARFLFSRWNV